MEIAFNRWHGSDCHCVSCLFVRHGMVGPDHMGLFSSSSGNPVPPKCNYCGKKDCFVFTNDIRYDRAKFIATCPKGKANDRACNEISEAYYQVGLRNQSKKRDDNIDPFGGMY